MMSWVLFGLGWAGFDRVSVGLDWVRKGWIGMGSLQANSKPGAPTATAAYNHTSHIRGLDAEIRLQEDALRFETLTAMAIDQSSLGFV